MSARCFVGGVTTCVLLSLLAALYAAVHAELQKHGYERKFLAEPIIVGEASSLSHEFTLSNDTGRQLRFGDPQLSCTCLSAELGAEELFPGAETVLRLSMSVSSGERSAICRLQDSRKRDWLFKLQQNVYERVCFGNGEQAMNLGRLRPDETTIRDVALKIRTRSIELPEPSLEGTATLKASFRYLGTKSLDEGIFEHSFSVIVECRPSRAEGVFSETLTCRGAFGYAGLSINWFCTGDYKWDPEVLVFGHSKESAQACLRAVDDSQFGLAFGKHRKHYENFSIELVPGVDQRSTVVVATLKPNADVHFQRTVCFRCRSNSLPEQDVFLKVLR